MAHPPKQGIAPLRALAPLLLGTALVAACSGTPTTNEAKAPGTTAGKGGGATAGGAAAAGNGAAPVAAPGVGTNPSNVAPAAPPPAQAKAEAAITFTGAGDEPFVDPVPDTSKATNLFFDGQWGVNGGYFEQSQGARSSSLTFRQYNGPGFGSANGVAPGKYRTDVTVWVYQPSAQYPDMVGAPLGILGYAPYYLDETHYLLAVAKPTMLEVWAVEGFQPGSEWPLASRMFKRDLAVPLQVGSPVAWSVEIDTTTQSARVWANGEELTTLNHAMIQDRGQRVALVSNGNFLHFQDFKVFKL